MSTGQTLSANSSGSKATEWLAAHVGARLKGGEVIELVSDLGGGKTTFVRGLVHGAGSPDHVSSPTFKISNEYYTDAPGRTRCIYHFDFYRLNDAGIVANEVAEVIGDPKDVVVVEWGDIIADVLPKQRLKIEIKNTGDNDREFVFNFPSELKYLVEDIK